MDIKAAKEKVWNYIKKGGKQVGSLALEIYGNSINQAGEVAFAQAIEIGIQNTITCLYDAAVDDNEILRVMCEYWGMSYQEAEDRLIYEKRQATIHALRKHLKLQGYSPEATQKFIFDHGAIGQIGHNPELWSLRKNPKKLVSTIVKENNNREKK